jgi:hypothetical protein
MGATVPAGRVAIPGGVAACLWLEVRRGHVTGARLRVHGGEETPA